MTTKTSWDLSHVQTDFEKEKKEIETEVEKFVKNWKNNSEIFENPIVLKKALDEYEKLANKHAAGGDEQYYLWLKNQQNQSDHEIKAKLNKSEEFGQEISNKLLFFKLNLSKLADQKQKKILASKEISEYKHFLEKVFAYGKYRLSEEEEKIMSLKDPVSSDNWEKMTSELLAKEERTIDGKTKSFSEIASLTSDKNKKVRDEAAKAFNEILARHSDVAEHELNSLLQDKKINDKIRNAPRADTMTHLGDDIETKIVDTLVQTVSSQFELAQKFYALKAKLLGQKKLAYHERNIPFGKIDEKVTFDQSVKLVADVFQKLDPEFSKIFKSALAEGRIDAFPQKGKRGGAFCVWWSPSKPVYVMLNHANKMRDVQTIAHEFGHAINAELSKKQNALQFSTPTSTSEVASTFMEDFVLQEILKEADEETKLAIMMEKLNDDISTIFRQIACYKLETDLHSEFRKKGYLSKQEIGKIFQKNMAAYMGPAVEQSPGSENWWIYWRHIRRYFYVYSYASGLLISKALQAKVKSNPKSIVQIKEFLAAGGSDSPEKIFKKLGIDINQEKFWLSGLKETENLLTETEKLAKKLRKSI